MASLAESIVEALPLAVLAIDGDNRIQHLNPAGEEWLGTSARFALAGHYPDFIAPHEGLERLIARARSEGESFSEYGLTVQLRRGDMHLVNVHVTPLPDGQLLLAFARMRYAPAQLQQAAREEVVKASGLMAAMLAHEVKNPLSGIRGAAQLLIDDIPPEQAALAQLICDEVDRIRNVLARVELFSEGAVITSERVNLHEVLRYVHRVVRTGDAAEINFREEFDPSLPDVLASHTALVQVLLNLIKNAAEALGGTVNPTITLITTSRQDFAVMGREGRISPQAHVIIQDNGPGVAAVLQEHIFEPFVSGNNDSNRGLGLAIAAKLAADMGGALALEKSENGCTRFRLTLKAA